MIRVLDQPLTPLLRNVYSQNGEDGVIEYLVSEVNLLSGSNLVVDVGAWDGIHLSNTKYQIDKGFSGLLIEADSIRAKSCRLLYQDNNFVNVIEKFVGPDYPLSELLSDNLKESRFLLLSIDIDGDDLAVLQSIGEFRPSIVVIEFNPEIPNHCDFKNPPGKRVGNSALAILNFAHTLNYSLAHATSTNLILFQNGHFKKSFPLLDLEQALDDTDTIKAVFAGYDGSLNVIGPNRLDYPWHGLSREFSSLILPRIVQRFPDELTTFGKVVYRALWFRQYWLVALKRRLSIGIYKSKNH